MTLLTDLAVAVRKSGLRVNERPGWKTNRSAGGEAYGGISIHHTGSYDDVGDTSSDQDYADWMGFTGRSDLPPPLCNLALSAESVVFVTAAGNANGVGEARASGPMPYARDGNALYIVIEAMNSGTQGWDTVGRDAAGKPITQYEAYVALCGALCLHYGWSAAVIRAHWETSVTGKWDPGDPGSGAGPDGRSMDMTKFRAAVARWMSDQEDPMAGITLDQIRDVVAEENRKALDKAVEEVVKRVLKPVRQQLKSTRAAGRKRGATLEEVLEGVEAAVAILGEDDEDGGAGVAAHAIPPGAGDLGGVRVGGGGGGGASTSANDEQP